MAGAHDPRAVEQPALDFNTPKRVQLASETQGGGVIDFDRTFSGVGTCWTARRKFDGSNLTVTTSVDHDRARDNRQGYENFVGTRLGTDNVFDRKHIGSVIPGDANRRFYEPGPTRSWYAGVSPSHAF